jgi:peptidoglycan/xylan/chitin deacetylase (PgdA/CDA1 family)
MTRLAALMYHRVQAPPPSTPHPGNFVSPERFAAQIDALLDWGFEHVTFDDWMARRADVRRLPRLPFTVTFDDGYDCFDRVAWPLLRPRGIRPTVFLVAGELGGTNRWDRDDPPATLLGRDRVRALRDEGVLFGSHSQTHVPLARVPLDRAREELVESKTTLEALLEAPVEWLSYPFSNQNADVRRLAREAGYRVAVRGGGKLNSPSTHLLGLFRVLMNESVTTDRLRAMVHPRRWQFWK